MGTDVAVRDHAPAMVRLSTDQLQYIAHTEFVPKSMRGKLPAILACVATGRSLGLSDMSALRSINIIDGKASFSAELMVSLVRERGHSIQGNFSGDSCTVVGKRADNGDEMSVTWTTEMARQAGLAGKDNWKKYAPSMLWARAVSQLCRMLFADCFAGATYTPEELDAGGDAAEWEDAEVAALEPRPGQLENQGEVAGVAPGESQNASPAVSAQVGAAQVSVEGPQAEGTDGNAVSVSAARESGEDPAGQPPSTEVDAEHAKRIKRLNVLVGKLRTGGHITNAQLYTAVGRDPEPSEDGELHWSPLRDSLTADEAEALKERLATFAKNVGV